MPFRAGQCVFTQWINGCGLEVAGVRELQRCWERGEGVNVCVCACGQACVMQACQEKHRRHPQHGRSPSNFQPPDKLLTSILHSKLVTVEGKQVMNAAFFNYWAIICFLKMTKLKENWQRSPASFIGRDKQMPQGVFTIPLNVVFI